MRAFRINRETLQKIHEEQYEFFGRDPEQGWEFNEKCYCRFCKEWRRADGIVRIMSDTDHTWRENIDFLSFIRMFLDRLSDEPGVIPDDIVGASVIAIKAEEVPDTGNNDTTGLPKD